MAEIDKSWKAYTCFSADYLKKKTQASDKTIMTIYYFHLQHVVVFVYTGVV